MHSESALLHSSMHSGFHVEVYVGTSTKSRTAILKPAANYHHNLYKKGGELHHIIEQSEAEVS